MINKNSKKKKAVVLSISLGYIIEEAFVPLIKDLCSDYKIYLVIDSILINKRHICIIEDLKKKNYITTYTILPTRNNLLKYHQKINTFCRFLKDRKSINAIFLCEDFSILSRYLIRFSNINNIKNLTLNLTPNGPLLYEYFKVIKGEDFFKNNNFLLKKNMINKLILVKKSQILVKFLFFHIKAKFINLILSLKKYTFNKLNFLLLPLIFFNLPFLKKKNIHNRITGIYTDILVTFDEYEFNALSYLSDKKVFFIKHPAEAIKIKKAEQSKILIIFSGCLKTEMLNKDKKIWFKKIIELSNILRVYRCDLRLHPLTIKKLKWPNELSKLLRENGLEVNILSDINNSLIKNISIYAGILGAPSGALLIASLIRKDIPVLGIADVSDHNLADNEWILGKPTNVNWISKDKPIDHDLFLSKKNEFQDNRLSIKELLINLNK